MKATVAYIKEKFDEFNRQMFGGELPPLPIKLSKARSYLGMLAFRKQWRLLKGYEFSDFRLRISTFLDLSEEELEDTIIHEMIHYYIAVRKMKDSSAHGKLFKEMMNDINTRYGRHVTVTHKATKEQREQAQDTRQRWHVVALVEFRDGRCGVKVLPRIKERIEYYYRNVTANSRVKAVSLYMSKDPYFNRFPTSSALNVVYADREEVLAHVERTLEGGTDRI